MARLYASTSFRPIINDRLDPVHDEKEETIIVGRTKKEQKREGSEGLLDIGVVCEKQASGRSFHGYRVYMDAKFPHIVFICGKRGGGKSYTMGVMAEELCNTRIGIGTVIVDPIGIYWSMKKENRNKKEIAELEKWGLKPTALENIRILGPPGLPGHASDILDGHFSIKPSELTSEEWCLVFGLDRFKIQGLLIGEALEKVREGYKVRKGPNEMEFIPGKGGDYAIEDIVDAIDRDTDLGSDERGYARTTRRSVIARFKAARKWGIFSQQGTPMNEISVWDRVTVIDVSHPKLENQIRALIVGILARKILQARMMSSRMEEIGVSGEAAKIPVTWLMIDEAHLLIPRRGLTAASKPLIEYAKLGRKPGCALVLATQRPAATDDDILSQIDILVGHSLGLEDDIAAFLKRTPAKLTTEMADSNFIRGIPSGYALLADQKTQQRTLLIQIRPRMTHHSGKEAMPARQVVPQEAPAGEPSPKPVVGAQSPGIRSIWGDEAKVPSKGGVMAEAQAEPSAEAEEEFEIVSVSAEVDEEPTRQAPPVEAAPDERGHEVVEGMDDITDLEDEESESIPTIILGEGAPEEEEKPIYADQAIMETLGFDQVDYSADTEAVLGESVEVPEEEVVGLGALEEDISAEETGSASAESQTGLGVTTGLAPDIQATQGEERDSFPVVLRKDSAKGLAIKAMRTSWSGRPKEYIESIELVQLPMFETTLVSRRKRRISGKVLIRTKLLFDTYMKEIVTDFREFRRSRGVARLTSLPGDYLGVIGCIIGKKFPEECEADLDMQRADIRDAMTELSEMGLITLSEDKNGYLKGALAKAVSFPAKPESIKGQLPSSNPIRLGRSLEERIDQESFNALIGAIYPGYEVEDFRRIYMPYYEVTYTSEEGSRRERINAFTGLFEALDSEGK